MQMAAKHWFVSVASMEIKWLLLYFDLIMHILSSIAKSCSKEIMYCRLLVMEVGGVFFPPPLSLVVYLVNVSERK